MTGRQNVQLLLIDPQNDFCDIPESELPILARSATKGEARPSAKPALPVSGGDADMKRLASFIARAGSFLTGIHVTLDSHNPVDIAHPTWWRDPAGASPAPFAVITAADVACGAWQARDPRFQAHSRQYVEALEISGRHQLVVWPEHCLVGSWGHNVHPMVKSALDDWARRELTQVDFLVKGLNPTTEHYSAIRAEVPDLDDPSTLPNQRLVAKLMDADLVLVAGEALSHCVANTVRDLAGLMGGDGIRKLILLTDCTSSVGGFEKLGADFVQDLSAKGMRTALSTELFGTANPLGRLA